MNGRIRLGLLALVTVGLAAVPFQTQMVSAQEASARFRVMVPEIQGVNGADKKFGERLADELRDLINEMATHQPIEEKELKSALKKYDLEMKDLGCTQARQLGGLINSQVIFCGSYSPEGDGYRVETKFIASSGEEFPVDPFSVPEKGQVEAAQQIYEALQVQSDQARAAQFCGDYASSSQWDDALNMCSQAIELNPLSVNSRFTRAAVYRELGRDEEALAEFEKVLELDALHENAMQNAGYLSAMLGRDEQARAYYEQYLMLNPANASIRMRIAYELAQAGDPLGAMQFIEVGLEVDPENVDLLTQHGGFAFTAGAELNQGQETMPAEAIALFRKALVSYAKVYEIQGAEMDVALLRNMVAARINLSEYDQAVTFGEEVLRTHGEEAAIWAIYADALKSAGRLDDAVQALGEVKSRDPEYPNISMRQGTWLLQDGRIDDAVPYLQDAVTRGEQSVDQIAYQVFANAVNEGIQKSQWNHAIRTLRLAKEFEVSPLTEQEFNFFLGYAIYSKAIADAAPNTLETARATLPQFQEAQRLLQTCGDYAQRNNRESSRQEILNAANTYIGIQEAIIKRGR